MGAGWVAAAFAGAILTAATVPAPAQEAPASVALLDSVFASWLSRHGMAKGALAVAWRNRLVYVAGVGGDDPGAPRPVMSLSKAVTAACVARLVQAGALRWTSPIGETLDRFFKLHGEPADPRFRAITIEQLVTHRAGFGRAFGDPAMRDFLVEHLHFYPVEETRMAEQLARMLPYPLASAPGAVYAYTNTAYLALGVLIESVARRPYAEHCAATVLRPAGIARARLDRRYGTLAAYGGWSLSGPDYLAFLRIYDPDGPVLDETTRRWMRDAAGQSRGGAHYALGMLMRNGAPDGRGARYWHDGAWFNAPGYLSQRGYRLAGDLGAYAFKESGGLSVFVSYEPHPPLARLDPIIGELRRAIDAVGDWPDVDLFPRYLGR
jgi:CubicO group peptidase (beta-lactamase class C family)